MWLVISRRKYLRRQLKEKQLNRKLALRLAVLIGGSACTKKESAETKSEDGRKVFYHLRTSAERSLDPMAQFDQDVGNAGCQPCTTACSNILI